VPGGPAGKAIVPFAFLRGMRRRWRQRSFGDHQKDVMRNPTILKSWLFVFPLAAALTGCTSLDAKTGAGRAAPGSLELKVGYGSEQPVELQVPVPDVNADVTQAIKEIESRRKADPLTRDSQEQPAGPPNLDHDVTQGIQSLGVDKALGR